MKLKIHVDGKVEGEKPHVRGTITTGDKVTVIDQDVEVEQFKRETKIGKRKGTK